MKMLDSILLFEQVSVHKTNNMPSRRAQITTQLIQFYERPVAKVSIELFFTIVTVIFFAIFAIRPTLITMSNLIKELQDKDQLDQKLAQKVATLSTVQEEYYRYQDQIGVLDEAIPPTPKFPEALAILEKIASDNQLLIFSIEAKQIPQEPLQDIAFTRKTRVTRPVVVTVSGDFPKLRQYIEDLRNTRRTFLIDSVTFSAIEERGQKKLRAAIHINVPYFDIDPNAVASASANQADGTQPTGVTP